MWYCSINNNSHSRLSEIPHCQRGLQHHSHRWCYPVCQRNTVPCLIFFLLPDLFLFPVLFWPSKPNFHPFCRSSAVTVTLNSADISSTACTKDSANLKVTCPTVAVQTLGWLLAFGIFRSFSNSFFANSDLHRRKCDDGHQPGWCCPRCWCQGRLSLNWNKRLRMYVIAHDQGQGCDCPRFVRRSTEYRPLDWCRVSGGLQSISLNCWHFLYLTPPPPRFPIRIFGRYLDSMGDSTTGVCRYGKDSFRSDIRIWIHFRIVKS